MSRSVLNYVQHLFAPVRSMGTAHSRSIKFATVSRSYYEVLRVPLNSSDKEIRRAFIELSKKYHPDGNSGLHDSDMFVRICEAYKALHKRSSIQRPAHRQRKRHNSFSTMKTNYSNNTVLNNWLKFQAAVRFKQFSYDNSLTASAKMRQMKPRGIRLLPSGQTEPAKSICCRELVRQPCFPSQSYANWIQNCLMTGFCLILGLLLIEAVKGAENSSEEIEPAPTDNH